jgi:hypothetical protein
MVAVVAPHTRLLIHWASCGVIWGNTAPGRRTLILVGKKLEAVMMTASVGLVMLLSPQRIVITRRKVLL